MSRRLSPRRFAEAAYNRLTVANILVMKPAETCRITTRDGKPLTVRRLTSADRQALQTFNATLTAVSRGKFLPHSYDDTTVHKVLNRAESGADYTLGAFAGDQLAAYFFLWRAEERVPLLGIGLLDEWQHRGLGTQLLAILIRQAQATGRDGIELTTLPDNQAGFALYQKLGFKYYADVENRDGDGRIVIERAMFYALKPGAKPLEGAHAPPV